MKKTFLFMLFALPCFISGCGLHSNDRDQTYSGTLEMTEHSLGFAASGRITDIFAEEGDSVTEGQLLARMEHYEQAQKDFNRAEKLVQSGAVSRQDYEHLEEAVDDFQILSPVKGIVLTKVHESGEAVTAGSPVLIVGETGKVWVKIYVPENMISHISLQQKARVSVDGLKTAVNGYVSYISSKAEFTPRNVQTPEERATQMFGVKVMLENPVNLHPGVSADVVFHQP